MAELEISINNSSNDPLNDFRAILGDFETRRGIKITPLLFDWGQAWSEVMKIVLYRHGPVMSQVGTSWLGSLESTQSIRPFTPAEINQLGGAGVFHPAAWQTGISLDYGRPMAIPWFLDTYVLYYRRDLLEKAGVDETHAFDSYDALAETVLKLASAGVEIPLAMPTQISSRANIHNLAGWVWTYGGEFISEDGKQLLLSSPKTRQGLKAYFSIYPAMTPAARCLSDAECAPAFLDYNAAITLRNANLIQVAQHSQGFAPHIPVWGVAAMPGQNFVGGSSMVMWNHIRPAEERLALEVLYELSSFSAQYEFFRRGGILPARLDVLKKLEQEPYYAPVVKTLMAGRTFHKLKLWGLIEDRLTVALGQIWQALYSKEHPNVEEEIARVLDPLEQRLQTTLSNS